MENNSNQITINNEDKLGEEVIKKIKDLERKHGRLYLTSEQKKPLIQLVPNENLRERYLKYGLCEECQQPNTGGKFWSGWCQACNSQYFQNNFQNWTSGNSEIDKFIQKKQLEATNQNQVLEWIPYEKFKNIEHIADGGFSKIYKAEWNKGEPNENKGGRSKTYTYFTKTVTLKSLNNSQNITADFLQEITRYKLFDEDSIDSSIIECYGISQDPNTKNYLMVMQYMEGGNLRQYLDKKYSNLNFYDKIFRLLCIATGLNSIHKQDLVHHDFHSGNILNGTTTTFYITDLGLSRPINEADDGKIYGILPYVAPEVLRGQSYTQAADIYSFGIVAYEVLTGLPPYYEQAHDSYLALDICKGLRPKFNIKIPKLLEDLINRCWSIDPLQRPTAQELYDNLSHWQLNFYNKESEFSKQFQETESYNKKLPKHIKFPDYKSKLHPKAVYHSKLLPTKEITQLLQKSKENNEQFYSFQQPTLRLEEFNLDELNLEDINSSETTTEIKETEQQAQIELPCKNNV